MQLVLQRRIKNSNGAFFDLMIQSMWAATAVFWWKNIKWGRFNWRKKNDFTLSSAWTNQYVMIFLSSSCAASHEDQRCHKIWRNFVILLWSSPYSFFPKLDMGQVFIFLIDYTYLLSSIITYKDRKYNSTRT